LNEKLYIVTTNGSMVCIDASEEAIAQAKEGTFKEAKSIKAPKAVEVLNDKEKLLKTSVRVWWLNVLKKAQNCVCMWSQMATRSHGMFSFLRTFVKMVLCMWLMLLKNLLVVGFIGLMGILRG